MHSDQGGSAAYLHHIRDNITLALRFVEGFNYERFRAEPLRVYGVTRALEIISEASRRLPVSTKQNHPDIAWVDIAGAGNVYRHDYMSVRESILWRTVHRDLPPLLAAIEQELRNLGELP